MVDDNHWVSRMSTPGTQSQMWNRIGFSAQEGQRREKKDL